MTSFPPISASRPVPRSTQALQCILASQTVIDGKKTIWPQQEDALTLAPVSARNYEPGALAASESADLLDYLMSLPNPSKELVASIQAGVAWLKAPRNLSGSNTPAAAASKVGGS